MISNPTFDNVVWNPVVAWQIGETRDGTAVVIVTMDGETGESVTAQFPDVSYFAGFVESMREALGYFLRVEGEGFEAVTAEIDLDADPRAPDDLSGLEE